MVRRSESDVVVWCVCELVRRSVGGGCRTCEVKVTEVAGGSEMVKVIVACQDDCPRGVLQGSSSSVDERVLCVADLLRQRFGSKTLCTTAEKGSTWKQFELDGTSVVERGEIGVAAGGTRLVSAVRLAPPHVADVERRVARFLARVVLARACEDTARVPLQVCLSRNDVVVARSSSRSFTNAIRATARDDDDDMQRALVAYGKSMVSGARDVACASAKSASSRVTVARFPGGTLFRTKSARRRAGHLELIRIVDREPLVDGFGGDRCALTRLVQDFDFAGYEASFVSDTPFLRFSLQDSRSASKRLKTGGGNDDSPPPLGDLLIAIEVDARDDDVGGGGGEPDRLDSECCLAVDDVHRLLKSCVRKLPSVFRPEADPAKILQAQLPVMLAAITDMAAHSKRAAFKNAVTSHPALDKIRSFTITNTSSFISPKDDADRDGGGIVSGRRRRRHHHTHSSST